MNPFIIIKPDAVANYKIGDILKQYELNWFSVKDAVFKKITLEEAQELYKEHLGRDYYDFLIEFMTSGPSLIVLLNNPSDINTAFSTYEDVIIQVRSIQKEIRSRFATNSMHNCVHASDSVDAAIRESRIFFK